MRQYPIVGDGVAGVTGVTTETILGHARADGDKERVRPATQLIERGVDVSVHAGHLLDDDLDLRSLLPETH